MLSSIRRSFGMSPSASASSIHAEYFDPSDAPAGLLSPSNKPNTLVPLPRSNSFTRFFSSSRSSSPTKDQTASSPSETMTSPTKAASSDAPTQANSEPVLAFLLLMDKRGRPKQRYPIQNLKTTMGRSIENDVRFLVKDVSRLHCTIEIEIQQQQDLNDSRAFLQVLGANGVILNGIHLLPAPRGAGRYELHTNDSIVIAKRSFVFELPTPTSDSAVPIICSSPVKGGASSTVPQTPLATSKRRIRMSLVNAAQIDTPAKPRKQASPNKLHDAEREARRANGLQRFMQSANVSPSKAKKASRQSLTSCSVANSFATPVKSRNSTVEPKTAPPKQVSFSLYANSYSGRLSPVKQMRMMPPLDTMNEEQDSSFGSNHEQTPAEHIPEEADEQEEADSPRDESEEDIVIVEELEQESEQSAEPEHVSFAHHASPAKSIANGEDKENAHPSTPTASSSTTATPGKSGSPKRAKRRSSFFGRAGPFAGMSLGFYAEERKDEPPQEPAASQADEAAEEFSDASDAESAPMDEDEPVEASPIQSRMPSRPMKLGISKTPSPVKKQHFVGLTPMPRRPRLSLNARRKVSLRTQTLLRSSEAYADRLFLPPPPPSPATPGTSGLSKSMSMPSNLSAMAPMQLPSAFAGSSSFEAEQEDQLQEEDEFEANLDPALSEEEHEPWKDSEDDEDEVDQSLSILSPSPKKAPAYNFSPVKASSLPQFATPQPASRTHSRRISMPPAGAAETKPSIRAALVRLQISGAGERIVHETSKAPASFQEQQSSPTKSRKIVRVSDVGLPATELSMGFDLVQDSAEEPESEKIAGALNDLFTAEEEEPTDDESEAEEEDEIVQISSKALETPSRAPASAALSTSMQVPQTPAALNSVRHLFSSASAQPSTPDMQGLASMLNSSPEKQPQYGNLGDRIRAANPEIVELLSPSIKSPRKVASSSPTKSRRGVRRSEAAEMPLPLPTTPRAASSVPSLASPAVTPLPPTVMMPPSVGGTPVRPAVEAELHVTLFEATEMDAQNEAIARELIEAEEENVQSIEAPKEEQPMEESAQAVSEEPVVEQVVDEPVAENEPEEKAVEAAEPAHHVATEAKIDIAPVVQLAEAEAGLVPAEPSPSKRASRRAASASPTKRTTRSVSPSKRATRSSPVKRTAAVVPAPDMFREVSLPVPVEKQDAEELVQEATEPMPKCPSKSKSRSSPVKQAPARRVEEEAAAQEPVAPEAEPSTEAGQEVSAPEPESPTKPTRRAGGRKAKTAAIEAISSDTAAKSPEKPVRKARAAATKKIEEQPPAEELGAEEEEEAPKKAIRTRATRSATTATTRSTRTRVAKAVEAAVPSSSAGYGDDEASEEEEAAAAAPVKAKRGARAKKAEVEEGGSPTKPVAKTTRKPAARTARSTRAKVAETSEAEEASEHEDEDEVPAKTTRALATTRTRAAKKTKAEANVEAEDVATSSSATTAGTTRSGRPRRAAAAK